MFRGKVEREARRKATRRKRNELCVCMRKRGGKETVGGKSKIEKRKYKIRKGKKCNE